MKSAKCILPVMVVLCLGMPFTARAESAPALVKDIWPGIESSSPGGMTTMGSTLYFSADDGTNGFEFWKTDGTEVGTSMVKDIYPGAGNSSGAGGFKVFGGALYFSASDGTTGHELWKSDGTEAGTVRVKDINPGAGSGYPVFLTVVGSTLFFSANDGTTGNELWKSDGTEAGTVMVRDINPGAGAGLSTEPFVVAGTTLYFRADDGTHGIELWKSDGTEAGTVMVKDLYPGAGNSSQPHYLTAMNGTLYFQANDGVDGVELWKSDGTEAGTVMVKDLSPGTGIGLNPSYLTAAGSVLYFTADDGMHGVELWTSDGTEAGTVLVKDIQSGLISSQPENLTALGSTLFFSARDLAHGQELWKSNGTEAGTLMVKDIRPGDKDSNLCNPAVMDSVLYFQAQDGVHGWELWKSNGTEAGTSMVMDIEPGPGSSVPGRITASGSTLYFLAMCETYGDYELWRYIPDPTMLPVPNVAGQTQANAQDAVTGADLTVGTVTGQCSDTVGTGLVISQNPVSGTPVRPGTVVALVVSTGVCPIAVPNLVGQNLVPALAVVTGIGLAVGTVTEQYHATIPAGQVISQDPASGTMVPPGTDVTLVVSKGPEPPTADAARTELADGFDDADSNGDGTLSFAEAQGVLPALTREVYYNLDIDANGVLSRTEVGLEESGGCKGCAGCASKKGTFAPEKWKDQLGDLFLAGLSLLGLAMAASLRYRR